MRRRPPLSRAARGPLVLLLASAALVAGVGLASATVPLPPHPWLTPVTPRSPVPPNANEAMCELDSVLCPDLAMRAPYQLRPDREHGHPMLRAANAVLSIGRGPVEVRGTRTGPRVMDAVQYLRRTDRRHSLPVPGGAGQIIFKPIPGQGGYWKFNNAAKFELWTLGDDRQLVRTGEKLVYCLRDLRRLWDWKRTPDHPVYPACSQNPKRKKVTLGTSPGWADIYPAPYYDQWIDVSGLKGCYELLHIADPENHIIESDETNNTSATRVRLPMGKKRVRTC